LHNKNWVFDKTPISANLFILSFRFADITFVLDFDKVNLNDNSTYLDNMPDEIISVYSF